MIFPFLLAVAGFWVGWGFLHQNNFFLIGGMVFLAVGSFLFGWEAKKRQGRRRRDG